MGTQIGYPQRMQKKYFRIRKYIFELVMLIIRILNDYELYNKLARMVNISLNQILFKALC